MRVGRWPIYPFLAAVYPIFALAASNSQEQIRPGDLTKPIGIALLAAVVAWLLARLVSPDRDRRAFLAFLGVGIFSGLGYGVDVWGWRVGGAGVASILILVPIAVTAILLRATQVSLQPVTKFFTLVFIILVGWTGVSFLVHFFKPRPRITLGDLPAAAATVRDTSDVPPNLFLIVLDKYAGHHSLSSTFGFDNTPFEETLRRQGFFVPKAPRANYVQTFLALAALLNWQYLDDVTRQVGADSADWSIVYPLIEDDRTWRLLKSLGYRFVFLPSGLAATDHNDSADVQIPDPSQMSHELEAIWLRGTVLGPLLDAVCPKLGCSSPNFPYVPEPATLLESKFDTIPAFAEGSQPVFVLAHLIVPHEPYIFDKNCGHRNPYWPAVDTGREEAAVKAAYVAQVQCVNKRVESLVGAIIKRSNRRVVIMLQADHGHGLFGRSVPPLTQVDKKGVFDRTDIFAAYYLPDAPSGLMSDSVGPVNAMRAVLRHYYGLDLAPLPEQTYWSSSDRPYNFTRVSP
jgi:hypothetical protein